MSFKNIAVYTIIGVLFGEFILHPLFMIVGHSMFESHFGHSHTLPELILSDYLNTFSLETVWWSIAFSIIGALMVIHIGYIMNMYYKLRDRSNLDGLTHITNRRHFEEELDRMWKQAIRLSKPVSIIMSDIDNFKAYNDTYGHQKGDECLKLVAHTLNISLKRPLDMVARYGGEEFIIVLPDTTLNGATHIAERMRERIESLKIMHKSSKTSDVVTISLGVASVIPTQNSSHEALIAEADKALYKAKENGRNRVTVSS